MECKTTGKKPTKLQQLDHEKRRALGHTVYVVDSKESVDYVIGMEKIILEKKIKDLFDI